MRRALTMLVVVSISCANAVLLSAAAGQSLPNDRYSRREADNIGARLFKAIVGRDGGATGPSDAATQIMLGHLDSQVEAMFNSSEFRQKAGGMNPTQILDQIYSGLLDRKADDAGVRTYLREIEQRKYAVVVLKIINDTEFETRILGRPTRQNRPNTSNRPDSRPDNRSDFGSSRPYGNRTVSMRSVEACQMEVLEQVRTDVAGTVLLNFQDPDMSSAGWGIETIRGSATDVLDRNHRLSYRCEMERNRSTPARVSYSFDDGRRRPTSGFGVDFPVPTAQSCQDAIRVQIGRERGRQELVFESAGVSPWTGGVELVFGVVRERASRGMWFEYRCEMSRGRVESADFQPIR